MYIIDWETFFEYEGMFMVIAGYEIPNIGDVEEGFEMDADAEIYMIDEVDGVEELVFWGIVPARIRKKRKGWELVELELR